jgi:TonB-linked SusC/RagA family outer membrane protein
LFAINPKSGQSYLGDVAPDRDAGFKNYFEGILSWQGEFNDLHRVGAQLVGNATEDMYGGASESIYETLPQKNLVLAGRFTYDYNSRYFMDFSFGYNGSEKFTGDKVYGFFPAVGAAWMVSNERFFQPLKNAVPMFKLKASWGKAGNDAIGRRDERFKFLSQISTPDNTFPLGNGGNGYRWGKDFTNSYGGYGILRYANPDITWEASTKTNLGLEFSLGKKELITAQIEVFKERRSQIYWNRENYPATSGLAASLAGNVGVVDAQGLDAQLQFQNQLTRDLWMQGRANFTYGRNKIVEIDEKLFPDEYLRRKGYPVNQEWGLIAERLFVDEAEIINSPKQDFGEYMAGDIKYKDVNGDGVVNNNDRVAMGYPTVPEIQYGYGLSMGYKQFDVSFFFQGNARVSIFINPGVTNPNDNDTKFDGIAPFVGYRNALPIVAQSYWSETNPDPHAFWPRLSTTPIDNNTQQSSWWMRNASFMRLKNIELGYNFRSLMFTENMRLYATIENAFVFTPFKLWDPEMGKKGLAYPLNRRFNIGIKLDF